MKVTGKIFKSYRLFVFSSRLRPSYINFYQKFLQFKILFVFFYKKKILNGHERNFEGHKMCARAAEEIDKNATLRTRPRAHSHFFIL